MWTPVIEMKQNCTFFHGAYSNLTSFFIGHKILKYFIDFYNWHMAISLQNWGQKNKIKLNETYANLTVFFVIYQVAYYLNDSWNLFLNFLIAFLKEKCPLFYSIS